MLRSMYSGVSGLKVHQNQMDIIGNNISNVNTTGFKSSRVVFKDMLSQNLQGAASPQGGRGGMNPKQIGLGVQLGSIDKNMGQGSLQSTGNETDIAVQGEGFFIVDNGDQNLYTRAGNMTFDEQGYLVNSANGSRVQGWIYYNDSNLPPTNIGNMENISLKKTMDAQATNTMTVDGNLDASKDTKTISTTVFDSLGFEHDVTITANKSSDNNWNITSSDINIDGDNPSSISPSPFNLNFNSEGTLDGSSDQQLTLNYDPGNEANPLDIEVDFSNISQFSGEMTADVKEVNGFSQGQLKDFTINDSGVIVGSYDNGHNQKLAQLALAEFSNPAGLKKNGDTMFAPTNNSGDPKVGAAGTGSRGLIASSTLEMSNVDLADQFTKMITSQRGFQANSKMITTSDEMLQELVNIKR